MPAKRIRWNFHLILRSRRAVSTIAIVLMVAIITAIIHAKIAAILTYLRAVWDGVADPLWPHIILLGVSVIAGVVVAVGIVYEANEYRERPIHRAAKWLVIWGVAVESLCTIALFVFDERISNAQESKIINLEGKIVDLEGQIAAFEDAEAPRMPDQGAIQSLAMRFAAMPVLIIPDQKEEPKQFSEWLKGAFPHPFWPVAVNPPSEPYLIPADGIKIEYAVDFERHPGMPVDLSKSYNNEARDAARALCQEFVREKIDARSIPVPTTQEWMGERWPSGFSTSGLVILVGQKPPFFFEWKWNKNRGSNGPMPRASRFACDG